MNPGVIFSKGTSAHNKSFSNNFTLKWNFRFEDKESKGRQLSKSNLKIKYILYKDIQFERQLPGRNPRCLVMMPPVSKVCGHLQGLKLCQLFVIQLLFLSLLQQGNVAKGKEKVVSHQGHSYSLSFQPSELYAVFLQTDQATGPRNRIYKSCLH